MNFKKTNFISQTKAHHFVIVCAVLFGVSSISSETPFTSVVAQAAVEPARPQKFVIKMSHFTDDLHAAVMGLKLANSLLKKGQDVTFFFNLESVRLVDKRSNADLSWGKHATSLLKLYEDAVAAGAKVIVCPHCAEAAGLKAENLRQGAKMGDEASIAELLIQADKVIDY